MMMLRCQRSSETFKIGKFTKPRHTDKESNGLQELQFVGQMNFLVYFTITLIMEGGTKRSY